MQLIARALLALCALALYPALARADEASGTWTGAIEGRGNYYWETSTRVIVPEAKVELAAPNGVRVGADYMVDVISSASIGQGVTEDGVLTELRHGVGASIGKEIELSGTQLDVSAHGRYSGENDYESWIYGFGTAVSLDQRSTKVSLDLSRTDDAIEANNDPTFRGDLRGLNAGLSIERVLNEVMTLTVGYQLAHLQGYLGNPYRRVVFENGAPLREQPPDTRTRHNVSGRFAFFVVPSDTAIHLGYRAYVDSWDMVALTPEIRVYQELSDLLLSVGYRYYRQTRASFAEENGRYAGSSDMGEGVPTTNDPKLLAMQTHTLGALVEYKLGVLEGTFLDFGAAGSIDLRVDRYWSSSTFGNGVIASAGGRLPF